MLQILKMTSFSFKISEQKQSFKCYPEFLDFRLITNPVAISTFFFPPKCLCLASIQLFSPQRQPIPVVFVPSVIMGNICNCPEVVTDL